MKKALIIVSVTILLFIMVAPVYAIYMPPSRVKPTPEDIKVATDFFAGLKWKITNGNPVKVALTIPKMASKYTVVIDQWNMEENNNIIDGNGLYQGSGGTAVETVINNVYKTGFHFFLANDSTSACIALELFYYYPGGTSIIYVPVQDRKYPSYDDNGNIEYWVNEDGKKINEDGTPYVKPGTKPAVVASFKDVNGHWALNEIKTLSDPGYIKGYPDGTFKPENNITRAEFMTMVGKIFSDKYPAGKSYTHDSFPIAFYDKFGSSHWGYGSVNDTLKFMPKDDIKKIFKEKFLPEKPITREEVVAVLHSVLINHINFQEVPVAELVLNDTDTSAFPDSVKFSIRYNIVSGYPDSTFRPQGNITRAEIAAVLVRMIENM